MPYDKQLFDSDLDAFKNSGVVQSRSITFNEVMGPGTEIVRRAAAITVEFPDFSQILFDNSAYHSGRYRSINEKYTMVPDNITFGGADIAYLFIEVSGNNIVVGVSKFNPYASNLTIGPVTINFLVIPYEATL